LSALSLAVSNILEIELEISYKCLGLVGGNSKKTASKNYALYYPLKMWMH
jgi:hypothetical protein